LEQRGWYSDIIGDKQVASSTLAVDIHSNTSHLWGMASGVPENEHVMWMKVLLTAKSV
jgi:hypothetical protein